MQRIMMEREMERKLDGIRGEIRRVEALVADKKRKAASDRSRLELDSLRAQERRIKQGIF